MMWLEQSAWPFFVSCCLSLFLLWAGGEIYPPIRFYKFENQVFIKNAAYGEETIPAL
jgi:hypothetical protein